MHLSRGNYTVRMASTDDEVKASFDLRRTCFGEVGGTADEYDALASHIIVTHNRTGESVATFRMALSNGASLQNSYCGQYYDLGALSAFKGPMLELGRFAVASRQSDPDILRIAWAALTEFVDDHGVRLLFGCSSFEGTSPELYQDGFALLKARHLAPTEWAPQAKAAQVYPFARLLADRAVPKAALAALPPLLRTYMVMGGWVSDHAVVDADMGTLHVFTGLEIDKIPAARKRLLRALV